MKSRPGVQMTKHFFLFFFFHKYSSVICEFYKMRISVSCGSMCLIVYSQICSHDRGKTVIPSQRSQCRAGRLPMRMLGYKHSAACFPPQLPSLQGLQGCSITAVEEPVPQHFHIVNSHSILLCSNLSIL